MLRTLAICALSLGLIGPTLAASFNCNPYYKSRQCPEIVICETPGLSRKDSDLGDAYLAVVNRVKNDVAVRNLKRRQKDWLASRDGCGCDAECLSDAYDERIKRLDEY